MKSVLIVEALNCLIVETIKQQRSLQPQLKTKNSKLKTQN